jgi:tRNA nucleotidyltransferase/poly(A) polymerase
MSQKDKAIAIIKRLRDEGYESYLAGGCVRDMLLGKTPQDYDITTSAKPDDIVKIFSKTVPLGAQFGVILVMVEGQPFEVASFRHDGRIWTAGGRPTCAMVVCRKIFSGATLRSMGWSMIRSRIDLSISSADESI